MPGLRGWRAELVWTLGDPAADVAALRHFPDGLLLVEDGRVVRAGAWADLAPTLGEAVAVEALPGRIITPGFVDGHIHFPQLDMVASLGTLRNAHCEILARPTLIATSVNTGNCRPESLASSTFFCRMPNSGSATFEHVGPTATSASVPAMRRMTEMPSAASQRSS